MSDQTTDSEALAWIRKKIKVPEDAQMFRGNETIAGRLHNICAYADGYINYIEAFKCDDKQGEIARQSVQIATLTARCEALEALVAGKDAEIDRLDNKVEILRDSASELKLQYEGLELKIKNLVDELTNGDELKSASEVFQDERIADILLAILEQDEK